MSFGDAGNQQQQQQPPSYMNLPPQQQDFGNPSPPTAQDPGAVAFTKLQKLLPRLSSTDLEAIQGEMRSCGREMFWTRSAPFALLVCGSIAFARNRLPKAYWFGPKSPWLFYPFLATGAATAAGIFVMGNCRDRLVPQIDALWDKYNAGGDGGTSGGGGGSARDAWAEIRARKRGAAQGGNLDDQSLGAHDQQQQQQQQATTGFVWEQPSQSQQVETDQQRRRREQDDRRRAAAFIYDHPGGFASGTGAGAGGLQYQDGARDFGIGTQQDTTTGGGGDSDRQWRGM